MSTTPEPAAVTVSTPRRRGRGRWLAIIVVGFALFVGVGYIFWHTTYEPNVPPPTDAKPLAEGNNKFAIELFKKVSSDSPGNFVISPYSVSSASAMVYAGARGETAREMKSALRFELPDDRLHASFGDTKRWLTQGRKPYELNIANALWSQEGLALAPDFLGLTKQHYGASVREVNFGNPSVSAKAINKWISDETRGRIRDLVKPEDLTQVQLVLANAVYFHGRWKQRFENTGDADFTTAANERVKVPMMWHKATHHSESTTDHWHMLELPYEGNELSMVILLPRTRNGLREAVLELTAKQLDEGFGRLAPSSRKAGVPRFEIKSRYELKKSLSSIGMPLAFTDGADFSGFDTASKLRLDDIIHAGTVEVDEAGTVATAVTYVGVVKAAGPPQPPEPFIADHPFLFLIRDTVAGNILFMGRVTDPR